MKRIMGSFVVISICVLLFDWTIDILFGRGFADSGFNLQNYILRTSEKYTLKFSGIIVLIYFFHNQLATFFYKTYLILKKPLNSGPPFSSLMNPSGPEKEKRKVKNK